jgi:hypothetical protein
LGVWAITQTPKPMHTVAWDTFPKTRLLLLVIVNRIFASRVPVRRQS